jgi:hypothetical protein
VRLAERVREDVGKRFATLLFADSVAAELRLDARLDPDAKREALRQVAVTRDEPGRLHANAFAFLSAKNATPARLEMALGAAELCVELEPRERAHRVLRAYALVRLGRAAEALDALSEGAISSRLMTLLNRRSSAAELAVEALAQLAAGKTASLAKTLEDLDAALEEIVVTNLDEKVAFAEIDEIQGELTRALGQVRDGENGSAESTLQDVDARLQGIVRSRVSAVALDPELAYLLGEAQAKLPGWRLREDLAERIANAR